MQNLPINEMDTLAQQLKNKGLSLQSHFYNESGWVFVFDNDKEAIEARKIVLERSQQPKLGLLALNQIQDGEKSSPEPTSGSASNTHKHYYLPQGLEDEPNDFNSAIHARLTDLRQVQESTAQ